MPRSKHQWEFKPRLRARAFGWRGSSLAAKRLTEAVSEIKAVARADAVTAADGAVELCERIWPAFEQIDTSSGALGEAVQRTLNEVIPLIISAPATREVRDRWLDRLWAAIEDDGVDYLHHVQERWGELCGDAAVASRWADDLIGAVRDAWTAGPGGYAPAATACLSCLLAANRHRDLFDLLAVARFPFWPFRRFGVKALIQEGRVEDALAFAENSRSPHNPNSFIDRACERILLDAGRPVEAYERYAMAAAGGNTGLATFRQLAKKYPDREPMEILTDLANHSGDPGRWFAAAKDAGQFDLALTLARRGRTDPRTLARAARDYPAKQPKFALECGRLALEGVLEDRGYDVTPLDAVDFYRHYIAAAKMLGVEGEARTAIRQRVEQFLAKMPSLIASRLLAEIDAKH